MNFNKRRSQRRLPVNAAKFMIEPTGHSPVMFHPGFDLFPGAASLATPSVSVKQHVLTNGHWLMWGDILLSGGAAGPLLEAMIKAAKATGVQGPWRFYNGTLNTEWKHPDYKVVLPKSGRYTVMPSAKGEIDLAPYWRDGRRVTMTENMEARRLVNWNRDTGEVGEVKAAERAESGEQTVLVTSPEPVAPAEPAEPSEPTEPVEPYRPQRAALDAMYWLALNDMEIDCAVNVEEGADGIGTLLLKRDSEIAVGVIIPMRVTQQ